MRRATHAKVTAPAWGALMMLGLLGGPAGCGSGEEGAPPPAAEAPAAEAPAEEKPPAAPPATGADAGSAQAEAREIFATRCFTCHGTEGRGDGPASAGLQPPPRNFHDLEWQASVTDDHLEKIILYGGAAVGRSPAMPPNPDLQSKPEVVRALVELIRSFGRPSAQ